MTRENHLLVCLAEECAEVTKEVTKILRFGKRDFDPNVPDFKPNLERLKTEIIDVIAVLDMLNDLKTIDLENIDLTTLVDAKKAKVEHYIIHAKGLGMIEE